MIARKLKINKMSLWWIGVVLALMLALALALSGVLLPLQRAKAIPNSSDFGNPSLREVSQPICDWFEQPGLR